MTLKARPRNAATQVVIVCGGGAAGLELCVRLARGGEARVVLVDPNPSHLWKPLLHEVAAGMLDAGAHEMSYVALARQHGFVFHQGPLAAVDPETHTVSVGAVHDASGARLIPERQLRYDQLVLAIGGLTEYFQTPGAQAHAVAMDTVADAEEIRRRLLLRACMTANYAEPPQAAPFRVVIVGGGATGVELAAELRAATRSLIAYGLDRLDPERAVALTIVNADPRLLAQLEPGISTSIAQTLGGMAVEVLNADPVTEVLADVVRTKSGRSIASDLTVWAAGVRGPGALASLSIARSRQGLFVVDANLRTSCPDIFALGDCAAFTLPDGKRVPASAQAAHQQAVYLARNLDAVSRGAGVPPFAYRNFGALVSLGSDTSVIGTLMGFVSGKNYRIRGFIAMLFYRWLYFRHRAAILGWIPATLESLGQSLARASRPQVKLH